MALRGIKVIELAGLAPAPFCGMILTDFGASVLRVDKLGANTDFDALGNGKQSIALNLKKPTAVKILRDLCKRSDVVIEPFRPGVMESLGLGPKILLKDNPRLIYARLTGYGQKGYYHERAGHDINYVAISGLLSLFGRAGEKPMFPINTIADFAGGGLMCALGIILALFERNTSNLGQIVDCSMVEGSAYLGSWLYRSQHLPIWGNNRGNNILDSGAHFYEVYETKDGKFMSVGAIEPQFYEKLLEGLQLDNVSQYGNFEEKKKLFAKKFLEKTQSEWCEIFDSTDACVAPILSLNEASKHQHNIQCDSFIKNYNSDQLVPDAAPKLSRTPGVSQSSKPPPQAGQHTTVILKELNYSNEEIKKLVTDNVVGVFNNSKL